MATVALVAHLLLCCAAAGCFGVETLPVFREPAPAILVDYHRTGGIAGADDRLVIFDNGAAIAATRSSSREIVLNATEMERIAGLFTSVQFSQLQANYPAPRGSADLLKHSVSYKGKTVTLEESAYPASVQPVIDELDRIITRAAA